MATQHTPDYQNVVFTTLLTLKILILYSKNVFCYFSDISESVRVLIYSSVDAVTGLKRLMMRSTNNVSC